MSTEKASDTAPVQPIFLPRCADCDGPIGQDKGPSDGWQLEDGRTVCHACCVQDTKECLDQASDKTLEGWRTAAGKIRIHDKDGEWFRVSKD